MSKTLDTKKYVLAILGVLLVNILPVLSQMIINLEGTGFQHRLSLSGIIKHFLLFVSSRWLKILGEQHQVLLVLNHSLVRGIRFE